MTDKQPAHIHQALTELEGTENEEQRKAAQKRLDAAGFRAAAVRSDATAESEPSQARQGLPKGRRSQQHTTA